MAESVFFVCTNCDKEIVSRGEGKPYYRDPDGTKHYAYPPDPLYEYCRGVDSQHLCLDCGAEFLIDSATPPADCPRCHSPELVNTHTLDARPCPFCKLGQFLRDLSREDI